jgi:uncharacterized protein YkwD
MLRKHAAAYSKISRTCKQQTLELEKNKAGIKHKKINGIPFPIIFSVSLFILFFMLALLPGCSLLFLPGTAHIENNYAVRNSGVWEESISSINITLKQFVACSAKQWAGINADKCFNAGKIKEAITPEGSPESDFRSLLNNYDDTPEVLGLTENNSGICSAALYSFYDNIAAQLKLFKNNSSLSESGAQKAAEAARETVKQQEADTGTAENQETSSQQQQNQQKGNQQSSSSGQEENFTAALLSLINNTRNSSGLKPLGLNPSLNSIAKSRCDDMIDRDYFSHVSPEGKDIKSFMDESGIMYKTTGENLQYCSPPSMAGPELFFNSWMDSETHRANILDPGYTQIGIALSSDADKAIAALVFLG